MTDRERLEAIVAEHQMSSGSWCIGKGCKFWATKVTDPQSRDFQRGWSTNTQSMRREHAKHIANLFFGRETT